MKAARLITAVCVAAAAAVTQVCATTIIPPSFDELVASADSVVRGVAQSVRCEWRGEGADRAIVTIVTFEVAEPLAGATPRVVELEFLGGAIGGESLAIVGQPQLKPGDHDILFIAGNGRSFCPLVAMGHGRYLIARDDAGGSVVARANGVPLASVDEVSLQLAEGGAAQLMQKMKRGEAMTLETFSAAVRESAARQGKPAARMEP